MNYFIIPAEAHKNRKPRIIVLNSIAKSVIDRMRRASCGSDYVFTYRGNPLTRVNNTGWRRCVRQAADQYPARFGNAAPGGFRTLHVHDLKHTFGRRLRAAGVSDRDLADLLGHFSGRVTDIYTEAEYDRMVALSELVTSENSINSPTLSQLKIAG